MNPRPSIMTGLVLSTTHSPALALTKGSLRHRGQVSRWALHCQAMLVVLMMLAIIAGGQGMVWGQTTIYVDPTSPATTPDGTSWTTAYHTLQEGLTSAGMNGSAPVWVAQGTYYPDQGGVYTPGDRYATFNIPDGVGVFGGFPSGGGLWEDRDPQAYPTILSGDLGHNDPPDPDPAMMLGYPAFTENAFHVVLFDNVYSMTTLDGVTIRGGMADNSGYPNESRGGGMMAINNAFPYIANCTFRGNASVSNGGAVHTSSGSNPSFYGCNFINNYSDLGGACDAYEGHLYFENCRFMGNVADRFGGALSSRSYASVYCVNGLFSGNTAYDSGGALYAYDSQEGAVDLLNTTFHANEALNDGGAIYSDAGYGWLANSILWGNTSAMSEQISCVNYSDWSIEYTDLEGGLPGIYDDGTNMINWDSGSCKNTDPIFTSPAGPDTIYGTEDDQLTLSPGSPCIDAANNNYLPDIPELNGGPRFCDDPNTVDTGMPNGSFPEVADLGPYEYCPSGDPCIPDPNMGVGSVQDVLFSRGQYRTDPCSPNEYEFSILVTGENLSQLETEFFCSWGGTYDTDNYFPTGSWTLPFSYHDPSPFPNGEFEFEAWEEGGMQHFEFYWYFSNDTYWSYLNDCNMLVTVAYDGGTWDTFFNYGYTTTATAPNQYPTIISPTDGAVDVDWDVVCQWAPWSIPNGPNPAIFVELEDHMNNDVALQYGIAPSTNSYDPGITLDPLSWYEYAVAFYNSDTQMVGDVPVTGAYFHQDSSSFETRDVLPSYYSISTSANVGGAVRVVPDMASYLEGTTVDVIADADPDWHFVRWSGDSTSTANPLSLTMDKDYSLWALFALDNPPPPSDPNTPSGPGTTYYDLTVSVEGNGTASPSSGPYAAGTMVYPQASPDLHHEFTGWSGDLSGTTSPSSLLIDGDKVITAHFAPVQHSLGTSTSSGGGTLSVDPPLASFDYGTSVEITAIPEDGHAFAGWSGDVTGDENPLQVTMTGDKTVIANFSPKHYTLTTHANLGSVWLDPNRPSYEHGTTVELTAQPDPNQVFMGWSGDATGTENPITITMDADKDVTALFQPEQVNFQFTQVGPGGVVPISSGLRDYGSVEQLHVELEPGYRVYSWSGTDNDDLLLPDNTATLNGDTSVEVRIAAAMQVDSFSLRLSPGSNTGSVVIKGHFQGDFPSLDEIKSGLRVKSEEYPTMGYMLTMRLWSANGFEYFIPPLPLNAGDIVNGVYHYRGSFSQPGLQLMQLDFNTNSFYIMFGGIDLTGMSAPVYLDVDLGDYLGMAEWSENIPMSLLSGYENALTIDYVLVQQNTLRDNADLIQVRGGIALMDPEIDLSHDELTFWFRGQSFTVPAHSFRRYGDLYVGVNVAIEEGGALTGIIRPASGYYLFMVRGVCIENMEPGSVECRLQFGSFDESASLNCRKATETERQLLNTGLQP